MSAPPLFITAARARCLADASLWVPVTVPEVLSVLPDVDHLREWADECGLLCRRAPGGFTLQARWREEQCPECHGYGGRECKDSTCTGVVRICQACGEPEADCEGHD